MDPIKEFDLKEQLKDVVFVVTASSYEKFCLWKEWNKRIKWESNTQGLLIEIGKLDHYPVCIHISVDRLEGKEILWIEMTSQVTDNRMMEKWLDKTCAPLWDNQTRLARTNAQNFHHVLACIQDT